MNSKILVKGIEVNYKKVNEEDYICITDLAKFDKQESFLVISHWLRTRNTIDYLTAWETLYNPDFKPTEIGRFREECSKNSFTMTPQKWVNSTNAVGIFSKAGNKGGTYAQKENPDKNGNLRDYATLHQLLVLANMESYNAIMIKDKIDMSTRLERLNETARQQLQVLLQVDNKLLLSNN